MLGRWETTVSYVSIHEQRQSKIVYQKIQISGRWFQGKAHFCKITLALLKLRRYYLADHFKIPFLHGDWKLHPTSGHSDPCHRGCPCRCWKKHHVMRRSYSVLSNLRAPKTPHIPDRESFSAWGNGMDYASRNGLTCKRATSGIWALSQIPLIARPLFSIVPTDWKPATG